MGDGFSYDAPVNAQFLRHSSNRFHSKPILPPDLLEQLHLPSPVQPPPSDRALPPASEYPVGFLPQVGQVEPPNWATSVRRNHSIAAEYHWPDWHPQVRAAVPVDPKILSPYVGKYQLGPNFDLVITVGNGHLIAQGSGQPNFLLYAESETLVLS